MPVKIIRPNAEGFYTGWTLAAGASKMVAVDSGDPVAHDDATTYIVGAAATNESFTTLGWPSGIGGINSIKIGHRGQRDGGAGTQTGQVFTRIAGVDATVQDSNNNVAWTTIGPNAANHPGGGSWLTSDCVGTTEMACTTSGGSGNFAMTTLWMELDYVPVSGGFSFFFQWLVPLVGAGLTWAQFRQAVRLIPSVRFSPADVLTFWQEYLTWTHRVWSI